MLLPVTIVWKERRKEYEMGWHVVLISLGISVWMMNSWWFCS